MGSEATAAAIGQEAMRRDPFAMLPFIGYHMGDYWAHWIKMGKNAAVTQKPEFFRVNWFRKDENGKFIWPGFGENMRVLKWIVDRVRGQADAAESPFGKMPRYEDITWAGLDFTEAQYNGIMDIAKEGALAEAQALKAYFETYGAHLPPELEEERKAFEDRANSAPDVWKIAS